MKTVLLKDIKNKRLQKLATSLRVKSVELLSSTSTKCGTYHLYEVDNILAITIGAGLLVQWDEKFDAMYAKHFDFQTSEK